MEDRPLVAHVHVPKTAGTAINGALEAALGPGRHHVEGIIDDAAVFASAVDESAWVAGHVPAPKLRAAIDVLDRNAVFVTALREPVSHVASHYNWLIEIGHRGEAFLNGHPPQIQTLHQKIASTDNSNPHAIIRNLSQHAGLFLNAQAKHVIGGAYADPLLSYTECLTAFDGVFLAGISAQRWVDFLPDAPIQPRNVAKAHFDRKVFDHPELQSFLRDRNRFDETLWIVAQDVEKRRSQKDLNV